MGIFDKFKISFKKSASSFSSGLRDIIIKKEINDQTLNQIEEYLIQSDVGLVAADEIKKIISHEKIDPKKNVMDEVNLILSNYIITLMKPLEYESFFNKKEKLNVVLVSGVNGVGKTTILNGMIDAITDKENSKAKFIDTEHWKETEISSDYFSSLVSVSFSAFDPFTPPKEQSDPAKGTCYF